MIGRPDLPTLRRDRERPRASTADDEAVLHLLAAWGADKRRRAEAVKVFAEEAATDGAAEPFTPLGHVTGDRFDLPCALALCLDRAPVGAVQRTPWMVPEADRQWLPLMTSAALGSEPAQRATRYRALVRFGLDDGGLVVRAERLQQRGVLRSVSDLDVLRGADLYAQAVRDARRLMRTNERRDARAPWLRYFAYLLADYQWATLYGLAGEPTWEWWRMLRAVGAACRSEIRKRRQSLGRSPFDRVSPTLQSRRAVPVESVPVPARRRAM